MPRIKPLGHPPKVWQVIEKINKDGKSIKFTIQEIPEDRYDDAVQHMCEYYLTDAPMHQCLNAKDNPLFIQDMITQWRLLLAEGISIAVFIDNLNGEKPIIAGMNVLGVVFKNQEDIISDYQFKSETCKKLCEIIDSTTKEVYKHYGGDKYLCSLGMSVDPKYRGNGLGSDMLKIRDLIGPMYGIPVTLTFFSSTISQKLAVDAGFEDLVTKNFADYVDKDGQEFFRGINSKIVKIMGKRLC